jgi:hypothetical protein
VSGFKHPKEFYQKIAECFDISVQDILFCTLSTRDVDMSRLLSDWPNPGDLIYVHCKGQSSVTSIYLKDLSIVISAQIFGNNFIRSTTTKKGKSASRVPSIEEGDHIQMINGENVVGFSTIGVVEMLKKIPMNSVVVLSLDKPRKVGDMLLDICASNQQEEETLDLLPLKNNRGDSSDDEHSEREDDMNDEDIEAGDGPYAEDSEEDDFGSLLEASSPLLSSLNNTIVDIEKNSHWNSTRAATGASKKHGCLANKRKRERARRRRNAWKERKRGHAAEQAAAATAATRAARTPGAAVTSRSSSYMRRSLHQDQQPSTGAEAAAGTTIGAAAVVRSSSRWQKQHL